MTHNQAVLCVETLKIYFKDEKFGNIFDKCPGSNKILKVKNFKYAKFNYYKNGVFDIIGGRHCVVGYFNGIYIGFFTNLNETIPEIRFEKMKDFFVYFKISSNDIV